LAKSPLQELAVDFKDHFSSHATEYCRYRPDYPEELYAFLLTHVSQFECAWDAATGNGQVAHTLSRYFKKIFANDASERQIQNALRAENIEYAVCRAEDTPLPDRSVDLVCVAQALHWFDHEGFYEEVRRVSRADAVIAAWAYGFLSIDPDIDLMIGGFNREIIARYWPEERAFVDARYETIPFPFRRFITPQFHITKELSLEGLLGYISTWSGVRNFMKQKGFNPLRELFPRLEGAWGNPCKMRRVQWPIYLLAGRVLDGVR
jgi:hypothetical protein